MPSEAPAPRPETSGFWSRARTLLPYALAAGLFALGRYALYKLLAPVDFVQVTAQIRATPWSTLAAAFGATLCAYLALAGYDWSALRYIGKPLPAPVVLTGSLMAYAFGNTIGLSAVSGGAVRWRVYSGLGLDGYDVAAVSAFTAVSFGVAATLVGLFALGAHPQALAAVLPLAPEMVRTLAVASIVAVVAPLVWASLSGKSLKLWRFDLRAPSLPILGGQVLFSLGDIGFSALTLYLLLPETGLGFFTFLAIFAAATMAGVVSHVPGGVGVFETVMLAALPSGAPTEQVAAALLLYRLIYYLLPFTLALIFLAIYEFWRSLGRSAETRSDRALTAVEPAMRALAPLAPLVLAAMIFGSGVWMSVSALIPPASEAAEAAETLFPLAFLPGVPALLSSVLGAGLIVVSLGVARRSLGAFWMAVGAMALGAVVEIARDGDMERAAALILAVAILTPFRSVFRRRATLTHAALTPGWILLVASAAASFAFVIFLVNRSDAYERELWWQLAANEGAPDSLRAGLVGGLTIGVFALILLLRAPRFRPRAPSGAALEKAAEIVAEWGEPEAAFALTGDKTLLFSEDERAFVAFGESGGSWIAWGGPVGEPGAAAEAAFQFLDAARRAGARPVFYDYGPQDAPLMWELGLTPHLLGEEALVELADFQPQGELAAACRRAREKGLALEILRPPHDAARIEILRGVSALWLSARGQREKGFSMGRFSPLWLERWPVALLRLEGRPVGFANLIHGRPEEAAADMLRLTPEAPPEALAFLCAEVMIRLKPEGVKSFSLGGAPAPPPGGAREAERRKRLWDRFGSRIYRLGAHHATMAESRAFKAGFHPVWRPRSYAAPPEAPPLSALADAARLIGGDSGPREGGA